MTRWLLILALTCTGLAPSASCFYAATATLTPAVADCEMHCCGPTCCCVEDTDTVPLPDVPATPPRGSDTLTPIFFFAASVMPAWTDESAGRPPSAWSYTSAMRNREWRAVQPMICRWLT